jgi:uncharacterized OsmC-like protein
VCLGSAHLDRQELAQSDRSQGSYRDPAQVEPCLQYYTVGTRRAKVTGHAAVAARGSVDARLRGHLSAFVLIRPPGRPGTIHDMSGFDAVVGAGTLQGTTTDLVRFPHRWTSEGVTVETSFTGAHLLHLAVAGCLLNDVYREAERLGFVVQGVRVTASGDFDTDTWHSTGISYVVDVDSPVSVDELEELLEAVDTVAEIPKSIRAGATVVRTRA